MYGACRAAPTFRSGIIIKSFKTSSESNVRTIFYSKDIEQALNESGWTIETKGNIYSPDL